MKKHGIDQIAPKQLLISVPVFGQIEYTHALVDDLCRESADFVIVDNGGDYTPSAGERVCRPTRNTGWAGGSNIGFRIAFSEGYERAMTLNNDTRLSPGFVSGMLDHRIPADAGIICPVYDDERAHRSLLSEFRGPAAEYEPRHRYRILEVADGTALMITRAAWIAVGGLDDRSFGEFGWGADLDLCLRVRDAGFGIYASELSFLNHFGKKTALANVSAFSYEYRSGRAMRRGLNRIHGKKWRPSAMAETCPVYALDDQRHLADVPVRSGRPTNR